jgi:hypothetical protein
MCDLSWNPLRLILLHRACGLALNFADSMRKPRRRASVELQDSKPKGTVDKAMLPGSALKAGYSERRDCALKGDF